MHPLDVQGRQVLAVERADVLRTDMREAAHGAGRARHRLGELLVTAGVRLAPDAAPCRDGREPPLADELAEPAF